MKTFLRLSVLFLIVFAGLVRAADPASAGPPPAPNREADLAALERFLDLSDEELDQMQRAIALLRAMDPGEKAALRREMERFRRLPEAERRQLRHGWGAVEAKVQDAWRRMMHAATPERRAEIQQQLQALPPEKKAEFRRQLAEEFLRREEKK
jgi:hypothetical protein